MVLNQATENLVLFLNSQKNDKSIMMFVTFAVPKQLDSRVYLMGFSNTKLIQNPDILETIPYSPFVLLVEGYSDKLLLQTIFELDIPLGISRSKILRWRVISLNGLKNASSIIPLLKGLGYSCKVLFDYDVAGQDVKHSFLSQLIKKIHGVSATKEIENAFHFGSRETQKETVRRKCKNMQIFLWEDDLEHMIAQTPEAAIELFSGYQDTFQM
jgi:predicted ATP-dependent endonuclease of OLD family